MAEDAETLAAVKARLTRDPRVRAPSEGGHLNVRCVGGVVWLEGMVDELSEKAVAGRLASEAPGVRQVLNRLLIRPHSARSDAEIARHVADGLEEDPYLDARQVAVTVANGVVTLGGSLDALAKKRLAGLIAWWVVGVTDVANEIAVEPFEADNDDELVDAVRVAFDKDKLVEASRYQVRARDGVVYLAGVARSATERRAAEDDVWSTWGVLDVVNQVAVEA